MRKYSVAKAWILVFTFNSNVRPSLWTGSRSRIGRRKRRRKRPRPKRAEWSWRRPLPPPQFLLGQLPSRHSFPPARFARGVFFRPIPNRSLFTGYVRPQLNSFIYFNHAAEGQHEQIRSLCPRPKIYTCGSGVGGSSFWSSTLLQLRLLKNAWSLIHGNLPPL